MKDFKINYKMWLEKNNINILGKGGAKLLELIDELKDLGAASEKMGCSYKHAWNILQKIKKRFNTSPVITHKGGSGGGGGIKLSEMGKKLLRTYIQFQDFLQNALKNPELWQSYGLKIESKNILKGKIIKIEKDEQVCKLKIELDTDQIIHSIITTESVKELKLIDNKEILALIKATEIQVSLGD